MERPSFYWDGALTSFSQTKQYDNTVGVLPDFFSNIRLHEILNLFILKNEIEKWNTTQEITISILSVYPTFIDNSPIVLSTDSLFYFEWYGLSSGKQGGL